MRAGATVLPSVEGSETGGSRVPNRCRHASSPRDCDVLLTLASLRSRTVHGLPGTFGTSSLQPREAASVASAGLGPPAQSLATYAPPAPATVCGVNSTSQSPSASG